MSHFPSLNLRFLISKNVITALAPYVSVRLLCVGTEGAHWYYW